MTSSKLAELICGDPLTDAERDVLHGAALGETAQQTGERLCYAYETVRERRKMATAKLGAPNLLRAVVLAISTGILNIAALIEDE